MTVSAVSEPRIVYTGSGTLGPFAVSKGGVAITFSDNSHIKVTRYSSATAQTGTVLVEDTDYTLTGGPSSGQVTLISPAQAVLTSSQRLVIERTQPVSQALNLAAGANFSAAALEARLDRLTEMIAEVKARAARTMEIHFADGSIGQMPDKASLANQVLGFDASGNPTVGDVSGVSDLVGFLDEIALVADADADIATLAASIASILTVAAAIDDNTISDLLTAIATEALTALGTLTPAANKVPYFTGAATADLLDFKDEDALTSDSATAVPSQQSTKAYIDAHLYFVDAHYADLSTAVAAAAAADASLIITQSHTVASNLSIGVPLDFRGGQINPNTGITVTISKQIDTREVAQLFGGAGTIAMSGAALFVRPEWWGAARDGSTDDADAINAAIGALPAAGGVVLLLPGVYAHESTITIGDGTDTAVSTRNGVVLQGAVSGVGAGEYSNGIVTSFKWTGTQSASNTALQVVGGIHSVRLENFIVNTQFRAKGIYLVHLYKCHVENVYVESWHVDSYAWDMTVRDVAAYTSPYTAGTSHGFMENVFRGWGSRLATTGLFRACRMAGGITNNVGFSRNVFRETTLLRGDQSTSISLETYYIDNNTFFDIFLVSSDSTPSTGIAWRRVTNSASTFPKENRMFGVQLIGAIQTVDDGTFTASTDGGWDFIFGHGGLDDGASTTFPHGIAAVHTDGKIGGRLTGSQYALNSYINSGIGLTTGTQYLQVGVYQDLAETGTYGEGTYFAPCDMTLHALQIHLGSAPGGSATRTFTLQVDHVDTAITFSYASGESGLKSDTGEVAVAAGSAISIKCTDTSSPATTQLSARVLVSNADFA